MRGIVSYLASVSKIRTNCSDIERQTWQAAAKLAAFARKWHSLRRNWQTCSPHESGSVRKQKYWRAAIPRDRCARRKAIKRRNLGDRREPSKYEPTSEMNRSRARAKTHAGAGSAHGNARYLIASTRFSSSIRSWLRPKMRPKTSSLCAPIHGAGRAAFACDNDGIPGKP